MVRQPFRCRDRKQFHLRRGNGASDRQQRLEHYRHPAADHVAQGRLGPRIVDHVEIGAATLFERLRGQVLQSAHRAGNGIQAARVFLDSAIRSASDFTASRFEARIP